MSMLDELKKWGNLGIPLKDVGNKIEKLSKCLEENKMMVKVDNINYNIKTDIINGEEKATSIAIEIMLFDGE